MIKSSIKALVFMFDKITNSLIKQNINEIDISAPSSVERNSLQLNVSLAIRPNRMFLKSELRGPSRLL